MSDQVLRSKLVRLAHARPEFRSHLLPLLKLGDSSKKTAAGKPYLTGLTKKVVQDNKGFMVYNIDKKENHSKFYEVLIEEAGGGWKLTRMWGALTDSGATGRMRTKIEIHRELRDAQRSMSGHYKKRISHGYTSAFSSKHVSPISGKKLPQGQYPIGLTRDAPFDWGNQSVTRCIPALKALVEQIEAAKTALEADSEAYFPPDEVADHLADALEAIDEVVHADSSMGGKLKKILGRARRRAVGAGRFKPDPGNRKFRSELVTIINYISKQTSFC